MEIYARDPFIIGLFFGSIIEIIIYNYLIKGVLF